jgi:hypothetical protein
VCLRETLSTRGGWRAHIRHLSDPYCAYKAVHFPARIGAGEEFAGVEFESDRDHQPIPVRQGAQCVAMELNFDASM